MMKNINTLIYIIIAVASMAVSLSCSTVATSDKPVAPEVDSLVVPGESVWYETVRENISVETFTYNGHSYIWFSDGGGTDNGTGGIVHDPDCHCFNRGGKSDEQ